ncbi:SRPBCC domain-containing protein [Streptomyces mirabilis]|uniref:SRPBCC domain-containing protein n=1 Tax=Streptomyces mirabilis TaxID=68239 RepID=UPI0033B3205B
MGSPFRYHSPDRSTLWGDNTVLDADPPHRLVVSYRALHNPDLATEPPSRVTWQAEADQSGVCLLTVVHDQLEHALKTAELAVVC